MDGTFNQLKPLDRVPWGSPDLHVFSFDLSSATDRLPMWIQTQFLGIILKDTDYASAWSDLLTQRRYFYQLGAYQQHWKGWSFAKTGPIQDSVAYATGQPMGALSSWGMLALTHHFIVQLSFWIITKSKKGYIPNRLFTSYALLGDDIVIWDKDVADYYLVIMRLLDVKVGLAKSVLSPNGLGLEFAKRTIIKGVDISPIPIKELRESIQSIPAFIAFKSKYSIPVLIGMRLLGFGYKVRSIIPDLSNCHNRYKLVLTNELLNSSLHAPGSLFLSDFMVGPGVIDAFKDSIYYSQTKNFSTNILPLDESLKIRLYIEFIKSLINETRSSITALLKNEASLKAHLVSWKHSTSSLPEVTITRGNETIFEFVPIHKYEEYKAKYLNKMTCGGTWVTKKLQHMYFIKITRPSVVTYPGPTFLLKGQPCTLAEFLKHFAFESLPLPTSPLPFSLDIWGQTFRNSAGFQTQTKIMNDFWSTHRSFFPIQKKTKHGFISLTPLKEIFGLFNPTYESRMLNTSLIPYGKEAFIASLPIMHFYVYESEYRNLLSRTSSILAKLRYAEETLCLVREYLLLLLSINSTDKSVSVEKMWDLIFNYPDGFAISEVIEVMPLFNVEKESSILEDRVISTSDYRDKE
jgi:hypothetical protein